MKKSFFKYISLILATVLLLFIFVSCGQKVTNNDYFQDFPYPDENSFPSIDDGNGNVTDDNPSDNLPNDEIPDELPEDQPPVEQESLEDVMLVSLTDQLNIRSGPATSYSSVGYIDTNDMVGYYGDSGEWYETRYKGVAAYISKKYTAKVEFEKGSDRVEDAIEIGKTLLGYPYLYGAARLHDGNGNLNSSFNKTLYDCSSFTQYIYYKTDYTLINTTSRSQSLQGNYVDRSDIQRGDLLFFTNTSRQYNTGLERIGHVGIYFGGNYIMHTSSDYAVIEPISAQRWNFYITARRV